MYVGNQSEPLHEKTNIVVSLTSLDPDQPVHLFNRIGSMLFTITSSKKKSLQSIQVASSKGKTSQSYLSRDISDSSHSLSSKSDRIPLSESQDKSSGVLQSSAETNGSSDSSNCQDHFRSATANRTGPVKKTNNNGQTNKDVFSTSGAIYGDNIKCLTSAIQQLCLKKPVSEDSEEEEEDEEEDEEEEEEEESVEKLYTLVEEDEHCTDQEEESEEDYLSHLLSNLRVTQNTRQTVPPSKQMDSDQDVDNHEESVSSSGVETGESGASLYMFHETIQDNHNDKSNGSVDHFSNSSNYDTARSADDTARSADIRHTQGDDDFHTAKETSNIDSMEMLTPRKKKESLVPVPVRSKVMELCDQTEPISFTAAITRPVLNKCRKIGEGVYGEVFRSYNNNQSVAIKIIPIEGDFLVNDEPQKKFDEVLPEIVIAKALSDLRFSKTSFTTTFCQVNSVSCVRGKYPADLLKQWDEYNKARRSENDRPDMFKEDQLFIVFEFADCGKDLESYKPDNLLQSASIVTQVTFALAVAEETLQFEHRDLHWGNVLVQTTDVEEMEFRLTGQTFRIPTMGVEASVIDYTLSRLTKDGCIVYSDLSKDDSLFQGKGDYQFDIYRKMKETNGNNWEIFCPHTNVLWLHYLADKLFNRNKTTLGDRKERKISRQAMQFLSQMLDYTSSMEMAVDTLFLNS